MYSADLGAALPTDTADLDPAVWRPANKDIALLTGRDDEQGEACGRLQHGAQLDV
jgi:hypothetical protein